MKIALVVFLIYSFCIYKVQAGRSSLHEIVRAPKPCQVLLQCPDTGMTAFASDGHKCFIFLNSCELFNANCRRHNVFFDTLEPITMLECMGMCKFNCDPEGTEICIFRDGDSMTIKSYCEWNKMMCEKGEYWHYVHAGPCMHVAVDVSDEEP